MPWTPEAIYMALPLPSQNTIPDSEGRSLLVERPTILPRGLAPHTGMLLGVGWGGGMWNLPEGKGSAATPSLPSLCSLSRPGGGCRAGDYM